MATIRSSCSECEEEVDLVPTAIQAFEYENGTSKYEFDCPKCSKHSVKPANDKILALLNAAGVETQRPDRPELMHVDDLPPDADAPSLTLDDAIAFHFALENELEELLGS